VRPRDARAESSRSQSQRKGDERGTKSYAACSTAAVAKRPRGQFDITALGVGDVSDEALAAAEPMRNE
jgi:hypothetical protein